MLVFCPAEPLSTFCDVLIRRESAQPVPAVPPVVSAGTVVESEEERRLLEAIQAEEERLQKMAFFRAIAGSDGDTLRKMLNEGLDPNVEIPVPVPAKFLQRFSTRAFATIFRKRRVSLVSCSQRRSAMTRL